MKYKDEYPGDQRPYKPKLNEEYSLQERNDPDFRKSIEKSSSLNLFQYINKFFKSIFSNKGRKKKV